MRLKVFLNLTLIFGLYVSANYAQQEMTVTATAGNTTASRVRIDMPGLENNPDAIIVVKSTNYTDNLQGIGAWFYLGKWYIFNTNHANITLGRTYKVQVFLTPGANQYLHVITPANAGQVFTILDHPALNNNPNAKFEILQNHSPDNRPSYLFPYSAYAVYSEYASKWTIQDVAGVHNFQAKTAFNVVISSIPVGTPIGPPPVSTLAPQVAPTNPVGFTVVAKTEWSVPSFVGSGLEDSLLYVGQCKSFIYTNPGILKTDTVVVTPQDQVVQVPNTVGANEDGTLLYLEWAGAASSQFVRIKLCNRLQAKAMVKGLKVNILVLR